MNHWIKLNLLPAIGAKFIRLLGRTMNITMNGEEIVEQFYRKGQSVIFVFWHGRQLMMPLAYQGKQAYVLISQHRDGELIHRIVSKFGFRSVRGSTTRGGRAALRELIKLGRQGVDLIVTPDGPRGPREKVQEGVLHLAKMTQLPIIPVTFACSKKKLSLVGTTL